MSASAVFAARLVKAQRGVTELLRSEPGHPALESLQRQLQQVAEWTGGGRWPTAAQVALLSFGVIAAREVEDRDLPLAELLHELSADLRDHAA